jgi:hypothetical protein
MGRETAENKSIRIKKMPENIFKSPSISQPTLREAAASLHRYSASTL